jgi:hypothetical protein
VPVAFQSSTRDGIWLFICQKKNLLTPAARRQCSRGALPPVSKQGLSWCSRTRPAAGAAAALPPAELSAGVWQRRGDGLTEFWLSGAAAEAPSTARCAAYPGERFMFRLHSGRRPKRRSSRVPDGVPRRPRSVFRNEVPGTANVALFRVPCD